MARVTVVGLWHLGCVVSACLAEDGNEVTGIDYDPQILNGLIQGRPPLFEPGLELLIKKNLETKRLRFVEQFKEVIPRQEFFFITFDTPVDESDQSDLTVIFRAVDEITKHADRDAVVVISSQVPVGTSREIQQMLDRRRKHRLEVVYSPENLRLGEALKTFQEPDRVVIGCDNHWAGDQLEKLYHFVKAPKLRMDLNSAEMTKHALNSFLANSISLINEIATLSESCGVDIRHVVKALKSDRRMGPYAFLNPGIGFAGGTLARDIQVLRKVGQRYQKPTPILDAVLVVNQDRPQRIKEKLLQFYPRLNAIQLCLFGLTYKPQTTTLRRSVAIALARDFLKEGAKIKAYDPMIREQDPQTEGITICQSPYEAAKGSSALLVATEWPQFKEVDFRRIKQEMDFPLLLDMKNFLEPEMLISIGFQYIGVGIDPNCLQKKVGP